MALDLIVGITGVCAILIYFAFSWDKNEHWILQLLVSLIVVFLLILVPKAAIDDANRCDIVVANSTAAGNTTSYQYEEFCSENPNSTSTTFLKSMVFFSRLFITYLVVYFNWVLWVKKRLDNWNMKRKRKKL